MNNVNFTNYIDLGVWRTGRWLEYVNLEVDVMKGC
jgi:hypothetical protein